MEPHNRTVNYAIVLSLISAFLLFNHIFDRSGHGLVRTSTAIFEGEKVSQRFFLDPFIHFLNWDLRRDSPETRELRIQWEGFIWLTQPEWIVLRNDADIVLEIEGETLIQGNTDWQYTEKVSTKPAPAGCHRIVIRYNDGFGHSAVSLCHNTRRGIQPIPSINLSPTPISASTFLYRRISWFLWIVGQFLIAASVMLWMRIGIQFYRERYAVENRTVAYPLGIWGLFLFGFLVRLILAIKSDWLVLADESIVGVLGQRIARGGFWPLMYLSQDYGGPFESYLLAPLFLLIGSSRIVLRMLPLLLSALAIPAIAWAVRQCMGKRAALIAAALWAVPPIMPLIHSMMVMVGPIENVFAAALAIGLWGTVTQREKVPVALTVLTGVSLGIALWVNAQILYLLVPLCILLFTPWRRCRSRIFYFTFYISLLAGSIPLLLYNIQHPFATVQALWSGNGQHSLAASFVKDFIHNALPALLGQKVSWRLMETLSVWPFYSTPVVLALIALLYASIAGIRNSFRERTTEQKTEARSLVLMVGTIFFGVFLFSFSSRPEKDPRHVFLLAPVFTMVIAWGISAASRKIPVIAVTLLSLQLFCNAYSIKQSDPRYYFQPIHKIAEGEFLPANLDEVENCLKAHNCNSAYAYYWLGTNLSFSCEEKIPVCSVPNNRQPDQEELALRSAKPAYIYHVNQVEYPVYDAFLQQMGWRREKFLPLLLYFTDTPLAAPKSDWICSSPANDSRVRFACDNVLENAWTPRPGDNSLTITLPSAVPLQCMAIVSSRIFGEETFTVDLGANSEQPLDLKPVMSHVQLTTLTVYHLPSTAVQTLTIHIPETNEAERLQICEIFLY